MTPEQLEERYEAARADLEQAFSGLKSLNEEYADSGIDSPQAVFMAAVEAQLKAAEKALQGLQLQD